MTESSIPPNAPGESIASGAAEPGTGVPGQADPESERQQEVAQEQAERGDEEREAEPLGSADRVPADADDPTPAGDDGPTGSTTEPAAADE